MPIYEYRCSTCGFQKEHIQKMSAAPLTTCPSCSAESYSKLLSAAGFQLKGSGWYATDFKDKGSSRSSGKTTDTSPEASPGQGGGCGGGCACHSA
ncbi:MAG: zinc ribbon domain-containing protein [Rhodocyclaceae bacterium]|nr:zinc ribbon domain-containing protein [Rhodocyclaceae bacterium]